MAPNCPCSGHREHERALERAMQPGGHGEADVLGFISLSPTYLDGEKGTLPFNDGMVKGW